ncbi:MAG: metallopeptidase family protein [Candidatus Firestonebacteria bacterium]|nr:metallopeptidase family protein [Candidatus Firestonebacteria bacterium]
MQIEEFEQEIERALKSLPGKFLEKLKNIQIITDDSAPKKKNSLLLGLYQGVPLKVRGAISEPLMPDKITLYKQSLEKISKTTKELRNNIRDTVVHEIGHYFGLEEKEIRKRGY